MPNDNATWKATQIEVTDRRGNPPEPPSHQDSATNLLNAIVGAATTAKGQTSDTNAIAMLTAVITAGTTCRDSHVCAPPSGPPATWVNCQTLTAHIAYVSDAWNTSVGTDAPDWAHVKDAMDHGGMGGDEPDFG